MSYSILRKHSNLSTYCNPNHVLIFNIIEVAKFVTLKKTRFSVTLHQ